MKRILLSILAIIFPWMVLLINNQAIGALACLALQLTFVGWIPASIWAWRIARELTAPPQNTTIAESNKEPETTSITTTEQPTEQKSNE